MDHIFAPLLIVTIALCTSTAGSDEIQTKVIQVRSRDLKSPEGLYVYKYDGGASEVTVTTDKIPIAWLMKDSSKSKSNQSLVQQMNFTEIILYEPLSINISLLVKDGEFITEKQLSYIVQKDESSTSAPPATTVPDETPDGFPPWGIGVTVMAALAVLAVLAVLAFIFWYRKNGNNGPVKSESSASFQNLLNNNLQGDSQTEGARDQGQDPNNHSLLPPHVNIYMSNCGQTEEDQTGENAEPEDHNEQKPFLPPDPRDQKQEGFEEKHEKYVVNMDEPEPGQDFGEEGERKPAEKENAEQAVDGMLEHGDCTTREVVSCDAVEAHSRRDDPLVVPNKEETRSKHSPSCDVSKTSGKGKRDNTKNSGATEEQFNNVEFVVTMTNYENKL